MAALMSRNDEKLLAEAVKSYPVLYDKNVSGYTDRATITRVWDELAKDLKFVSTGEKAEQMFTTLKKKYQRKKRDFDDASKLGISSKFLAKARGAMDDYEFMTWLDKHFAVRRRKTDLVNTSENNPVSPRRCFNVETTLNRRHVLTGKEKIEEEEQAGDVEEIEGPYYYNDDSNLPVSETSSTIESKTTGREVDWAAAKPVKRPERKQRWSAAAATSSQDEDEESTSEGEHTNRKSKKRKKTEENTEELFCKCLALELKGLPPYQRCIAKKEIGDIMFKHQMAVLNQKEYNFSNTSRENPTVVLMDS